MLGVSFYWMDLELTPLCLTQEFLDVFGNPGIVQKTADSLYNDRGVHKKMAYTRGRQPLLMMSAI